MSEFYNCEFCNCYTNAKVRACCDKGRDEDRANAEVARLEDAMNKHGFRGNPLRVFPSEPKCVKVHDAHSLCEGLAAAYVSGWIRSKVVDHGSWSCSVWTMNSEFVITYCPFCGVSIA